jgi:hypothetical protein
MNNGINSMQKVYDKLKGMEDKKKCDIFFISFLIMVLIALMIIFPNKFAIFDLGGSIFSLFIAYCIARFIMEFR